MRESEIQSESERNRDGARPVPLIITMIKWIRTSRLSMKNSLFENGEADPESVYRTLALSLSRSLSLSLSLTHTHTPSRSLYLSLPTRRTGVESASRRHPIDVSHWPRCVQRAHFSRRLAAPKQYNNATRWRWWLQTGTACHHCIVMASRCKNC